MKTIKFKELKANDRVKTLHSGMATVVSYNGGTMVKLDCDVKRWNCPYFYEHELDLKIKETITKKEKYIGAFLDGYFVANKIEYGFKYFAELGYATKLAKKKWKQYKKQNLS